MKPITIPMKPFDPNDKKTWPETGNYLCAYPVAQLGRKPDVLPMAVLRFNKREGKWTTLDPLDPKRVISSYVHGFAPVTNLEAVVK